MISTAQIVSVSEFTVDPSYCTVAYALATTDASTDYTQIATFDDTPTDMELTFDY